MRTLFKGLLSLIILALGAYFSKTQYDSYRGKFTEIVHGEEIASTTLESRQTTEANTLSTKSQADKEKVMAAETALMSSYGLYYDYANLSLEEVVKEFMKEQGIEEGQIAISYKDITSGELISYNETQAMRAGSTYKLPLAMLIKDKVDAGQLSMDERYDISETGFELASEHLAYMKQFSGAMKISDMWEYALMYSENTPAYKMAELLGGYESAYSQFSKYGYSEKSEIKTFSLENPTNYTTTDYYIQVLEYLYNNQERYSEIIKYVEESFPNDYYKKYLPGLRIIQKPGFSKEAINVSAIVYEEKPYLVAIYTRYLGGSNENTIEIDLEGLSVLTKLTYVVNQWHRVNKN
ncbi:serine hydrolase [Gemella sp. 19428wG2_WT2a]|nr:serine hydrolase [Gemella sp. 19428wG2_WT2a]TFU59924.1 D-alanyl-D-alanine carboxypeptidase [Gemella sp. WT2a]